MWAAAEEPPATELATEGIPPVASPAAKTFSTLVQYVESTSIAFATIGWSSVVLTPRSLAI